MDFLFGVNFAVALSMCLGFLMRERKMNRADGLILLCLVMTAGQFILLGLSNGVEGLPLWLRIYAGGSGFFLLQALLLAYIVELVRASRWISVFGCLPFFTHYVLLLINSWQVPEQFQFVYGFMVVVATSAWEKWVGSLLLLLALAFPLSGIWLINNWQARIRQHYSEITDIELAWLKRLLVGSLLVLVIGAILVAPLLEYFSLPIATNLQFLLVLISGFILYLGTWSLRQRQILQKGHHASASTAAYLSAKELEQARVQLLAFTQAEEPYLQQRITLDQFAELIHWPTFKVSEVLNRGLKQNFYEFINSYRVARVKRLISESGGDKSINLLDAAMAAGFNSKTSFNTVFKRFEGMTPSAFRKKVAVTAGEKS